MKIAFLTEMGFEGKIPFDHPNMRTEFAWMYALNADHYNIFQYQSVKNYDVVVLLFPQGCVMVDCHGVELPKRKRDVLKELLSVNIVEELKNNNKKVYHMQEGPSWLFNEYDIEVQFNYYRNLSYCDVLLAHNQSDVNWYTGLFPDKRVEVMPTLLIETNAPSKKSQENKVMIGGNFSRWYGGFQSFIVSQEFEAEKWTQDSHSKRTNEEAISGLNHLPRMNWTEWMSELSSFKYAVHLMPTVAAGTFSLNCAYYGIPCIGNKKMDTQRLCYPDLSVDVEDVESARYLAKKLQNEPEFYSKCSKKSLRLFNEHYSLDSWKQKIKLIF